MGAIVIAMVRSRIHGVRRIERVWTWTRGLVFVFEKSHFVVIGFISFLN